MKSIKTARKPKSTKIIVTEIKSYQNHNYIIKLHETGKY